MGLFKKITSNPLRAAAAVGTLGSSELAIAAGKKLGIGLEDEQGAYITPEAQQAALYRGFANDYDNQMGLADKGVREGALTRDVFGEGGLQSRLANEGRELSSRGFKLTQDDREAYGQVSGDVSRLFGQGEQELSQSLARRGLASAGSGAAGAAFSGLQGNRNEMLQQAQMNIATKRMEDTRQRSLQNAQLQGQLATQGAGLSQKRYDTKEQSLRFAMNAEGQQNAAKQQALANQQAAVKPGLFSTIGQGLQAGIGNLATQAPGMAVTSMTGMPMGGGQKPGGFGNQQNTYGLNSRGQTQQQQDLEPYKGLERATVQRTYYS